MKTQKRKQDHLRICLKHDVEYEKGNGFEKYELVHNALPEMDFDEADMSTKFLGKKFLAPILIEAMTGGTKAAARINRRLAQAAQSLGIGMVVGSQRAMIEDGDVAYSYKVRGVAPNIFLAGNIGAAQIREFGVQEIVGAAEEIGANALAVHLNAGQEMAQDEGHFKWKGTLSAIRDLCSGTKMPVMVKEVGCGVSGKVAGSLQKAGAAAIDVAGAGGTSWIKVDSLITGKSMHNFYEWGTPTAECLEQCMRSVSIPVIASGGIRSGVDAAKAISMGASLAGLALPLLKPATKSSDHVHDALEKLILELKTSMFLTGARNLSELKGRTVKR